MGKNKNKRLSTKSPKDSLPQRLTRASHRLNANQRDDIHDSPIVSLITDSNIVVLPEPQRRALVVPKPKIQHQSKKQPEEQYIESNNDHRASLDSLNVSSSNEETSIVIQRQAPSSFVDQVTPIPKMPKWLVKDPFDAGKWNFKMRRFKFHKIANNNDLDDKDKIREWSWSKFQSVVSSLATNYFTELYKCYKKGVSAQFRRHFSAAVNYSFPRLEAAYEKFRQSLADDQLLGVKRTTLKPDTFTEFFYFRLERRFRYYLQKEATTNGFQLPKRKLNGESVAANNKKRKLVADQKLQSERQDSED